MTRIHYKMRAASTEQVETWQKRQVSIHEAGHAVVASVLGAQSVSARIFKAKRPKPNERTWRGYMESDYSLLTALQRAAIGISGELALWNSSLETDGEAMGGEWNRVFMDYIEAELWYEPSPSDWRIMGRQWKVRPQLVTDLAGEILLENWQAVKSVARWLRLEGFIFHEQIRMVVREPRSSLETIPFEDLPQHPSLTA